MGHDADYYDNYVGTTPEDYVRRTQLENPEQMERMRSVVEALPGDATSVLDVGCGGGIALHLLREARPDVRAVGLEKSPKTAAAARSLFDVEVVEGSADALPFEDGAFDVVMANEVLEHLPWGVYDRTVSEICRVARHGVLITTPFAERRQFVTCPKCRCAFNPFYHLRSFDDAILKGLFPGFERQRLDIIWTRGRAPLLYESRRLKAALGWTPPLPRHTICPQCGYRNAPKATKTPKSTSESAPATSKRGRDILLKVWGAIPRPKRPRWALAVYTRDP